MKQTLLNSASLVCSRLSGTIVFFVLATALSLSLHGQISAGINNINNATCFGGSDGAIDINVSGGTAPYSFAWSNGATTEDISGLSAGFYSVTITDAALATTTLNASVGQPSQIVINRFITDVSCNGGNDGAILTTVSGGTSPYSYLWSNGDTSSAINNQPSGPYTLTVTDANGCVASATDTIGEPSQFFIFSSSTTPVSCFGGSDGTATLNLAGGILPYTFLWSNGATTKDLTNVPAGTYSVTATDNNGCKDFATVTITEPATPVSSSFTVTDASCFSTNDGSIDVSVAGGTPPYIFSWNTGDTTEDLNNISAGNYILTVTDANGCVHLVTSVVNATDSIPPVAICRNIDAYLNASGNVTIAGADLDNGSTDNCGVANYSLSRSSFSCTDLGSNQVDLVVFDSNGNTDTCSAQVTIIDTLGPQLNLVNADVYLDANGQGSVTAAQIDNGTNDACGLDTIILDQYNFNCSDLGSFSVEVTAFDDQGNTTVGSVTINVIDTVSPIALAQNIVVFLNAAGNVSVDPAQVDNGSSDFCGIDSMFLDRDFFDCSDIGVQNVRLSVMDASGNISLANASVDVVDNLPPQLSLNNATVYLDASGQAVLSPADVVNSVSDNCALDTVTLDRSLFDCSDVGTANVQVTALDIYGNIQTASAAVTVVDTNAPVVVTQNTALNLDATGNGQITIADVLLFANASCGIDTAYLDRSNFDCQDVGQARVYVTAVGVNGLITTDSVLVSVIDPVAPNMVASPVSIYLDENGLANLALNQVNDGSSDACGLDSMYLSETLFDCSMIGPFSVTLNGIDVNGNTASTTVTVNIIDTISPSLTVQDVTVYLDNSGQATVNPGSVVTASSDNCGFTNVSLSQSVFGCADVGVNSINAVINDPSGNTSSATLTVTVIDTVAPNLVAQDINLYLDANGTANLTPADIDGGSATACGIDSLFVSKEMFNCADVGVNSVVLTGIATNGQSTSDTALVTVYDTVSPQLITGTVNLFLDNAGMADIRNVALSNITEEACAINSVFFSRELFNCSDIGNQRIAVSIADINGNSTNDSINVLVQDTIAPNLANQNITLYLDSTGNASITLADINTGSIDVCGMDTVYLDRYNFTCADAGVNTVNVIGIDLNGTVGTAPATVTVIDTNYPVALARNRTIYVDQSGLAYLNPADVDLGSYDGNCGVNLSLSDSIFDCGELGLNLIQLYVSDAAGNMDSADVFVTVRDTIKPTLHLRSMTLNLDQNGQAWLNDASVFDSASTDNCANLLAFSASQLQFDCNDLGAQTVMVTATDDKLNSASAPVTVNIVDATLPQIITRNRTLYLDASGQAVATPLDIDNGSNDNCGLDSLWLSKSIFTGNDLGGNTVTLYGRDAGGLINSGIAIITVVDTINPVLSTQPVNLYLDANGQASLAGSAAAAAASDNHGIMQFTASKTNFACADLGQNTVSITAFDPSGNRVSGAVTVMVMDTLAPVVSGSPATLYLDAAGNASLSVQDVNGSAADNCSLRSLSLSQSLFQCADLGNKQVSLVATDTEGNSDSILLNITVADTLAPTFTAMPADTTIEANDSTCGAVVNYQFPMIADNCSFMTTASNYPPGSFFPVGTTAVQITVTDGSGNSSTASFNINVEDKAAPQVVSAPQNDTVGACQSTYYFQDPVAVDNCSGTTVKQILGIPSGGFYPVGTTINAFQISDDSGNDTVVSFYVVVESIGQPSLPSVLSVCENDDPVDLTQGQSMQWSGKGMTNNKFDPATAGTGTHVLSYNYWDDNGCASTGSVAITVLPKPNKPVIKRIGSNTLSTGAYNSYQWYRDGVAIAGATSQNYTYTTGGNYQVMVSNVNSCTDHSDAYVVGSSGGGIGLEENPLGALEVYPNPSHGVITIELKDVAEEQISVQVFTITGQLVFEHAETTGSEGQLQLDLTALPNAAYMLQISAEQGRVVRQIIIQ